ncbi:MAG: pseudouridine synthase, partial [Candidatus Rifleibacteriota bacterium]
MKYDLNFSIIIDKRSSGKTLIDAVIERFTYHRGDYWRAKITNGLIRINDQITKPDQILVDGDALTFIIENFEEPDINCEYQIVYQNDFLFLINKPAGLPVHSTRRFYRQTLVETMRRRQNIARISPLQRLDRETSGLMFVADNDRVPPRFYKRLGNYLKRKYYLAIVRGRFPWEQKHLAQPLKEALTPPVQYRMIPSEDGKNAETCFRLLNANDNCSLVLAEIVSGRKHQIRAHLQYLGFPLIGEKLYYKDAYYFIKRCNDEMTDKDWNELGAHNHLLHSFAILTRLPGHQDEIFFGENLPEEFLQKADIFPDWLKKAKQTVISLNRE